MLGSLQGAVVPSVSCYCVLLYRVTVKGKFTVILQNQPLQELKDEDQCSLLNLGNGWVLVVTVAHDAVQITMKWLDIISTLLHIHTHLLMQCLIPWDFLYCSHWWAGTETHGVARKQRCLCYIYNLRHHQLHQNIIWTGLRGSALLMNQPTRKHGWRAYKDILSS